MADMPTPFPGRIGRTLTDSEPYFSEPAHPGEDAPNVVVVLMDDTGFAQFGCYGSDIDTHHVDALAANGVQFTNFHVTPLCSPTRAALLTGRSQHAVGMRGVSNWRTGFPHQLGHISNRASTIAEVLGSEGYVTFCTGKWHLAPTQDTSAAGPFDQWPLGRGFDRFYGFLEGETDQFHPELVRDNTHIDPPATPEDGYHVSEDLVDQLIGMINDSKGVRPDRPFFAYLPFGATHAPHQAPAEYLAKYRGTVRRGMGRHSAALVRASVGARGDSRAARRWRHATPASRHGMICRRTSSGWRAVSRRRSPRSSTTPTIRSAVWSTDCDEMGQLDNTILVVMADNGASQEGGPFGVMHEMKFFNGILETPDEAIERVDDIGGPHSHTNYPWGWAQCGNSPFKWYKQNTHEGGVHVPMIVHWPAGLVDEQTRHET